MKSIISKYINIITLFLLLLVSIANANIAYNNHLQAQNEFMKNSLSFLLLKEKDSNFLDTLKKFSDSHKDIEISYRTNEDKEIFSTNNFDYNLYKNLLAKREDEISNKNIFSDSRFIYKSQNQNILIIAKTENFWYKLSFFDYKIFIFFLMFILLVNIFISNRIIEKIMKPIKEHKRKGDYLYSSDEKLINDLENYYLSINNKEKTSFLERENEILKARIFDFKDMAENMEEGFIFFNNKGNIQIINEAAKNLLGVDKNRTIENLIDSPEYTLALRETKLLSRGKSIDIKVKNNDIRLFIDPIIDSYGDSYLLLAIDDSENKKAESMRREFTANVTHELKSPLTSINGYAELIAEGFAKEEDLKKFAHIIYKEGNRLLNIIDDILKLSKLDEKSFEESKVSIDVKEVFDSCILKFKTITDQKEIKIENKIESFKIKTNESLFADLITNIYENAIKYNKHQGKIILSSEFNDNKYKICIEDTGIGIKSENLNRIFERFFVVDKSRARTMKSTGLGLSIVKHICNYLNYDIDVESEFGKGTKFIISIDL